jgi:hypothetical protein
MSFNNFYLWRNTAQNLEFCIDEIENQTFEFDDELETKAYINVLELLKSVKENDFNLDNLLEEAKKHL